MSSATPLQRKIGGSTRNLDRAAIIAAAGRHLATATPQIELALEEYRFALRRAMIGTDLQGVFAAAHEIRGIAGTIGRPSIGKIADALARYMTGCADAELACEARIVRLFVDTLNRAFDLQEGDAPLAEAVEATATLAAAFGWDPTDKERRDTL